MTNFIEMRPQDNTIVVSILKSLLPSDSRVYVFGSRAKGQVKRSSDLDLAIDLGRPLTRAETLTLADAFEESDLPFRVDVVDLSIASGTMRKTILNEGLLLG